MAFYSLTTGSKHNTLREVCEKSLLQRCYLILIPNKSIAKNNAKIFNK